MNRLVGRQRNARRILRVHLSVVTQRTERRRDELLRHALVGLARDVVNLQAAAALGDVQIFASQLQAADLAGAMAGAVLQSRSFLSCSANQSG